MISICAKCSLLYEALSEEAACEPGSVCCSCWRKGWRPDGAGGLYQLDQVAVPRAFADALATAKAGRLVQL